MPVLTAVLALGGLAALLAVLLAVAARRLAVDEDPRVAELVELLPGNNCGACGHGGCEAFAHALLAGEAQPALCTVASAESKSAVAALLGVGVGEATRRVARPARAGGNNVARLRARYEGVPSCAAAALVAGGPKSCLWGCLGFGDCAVSCTFDAIALDAHELPVVDEGACTACGDCVEACPKDLFELVDAEQALWVTCRNEQAGDALLEDCEVACTACGRCAFDAPDVVTMVGNLPNIAGAGRAARAAIERCPTGAIVWVDDAGGYQRGRLAEPIVRVGARPVAAS